MYGDEETGTLPEELYSKFDAVNATKMCDTIHEFVKKLIVQWDIVDHTEVPLSWNY